MNESQVEFIEADWAAPASVKAFCTTRSGGYSRPPYNSFNLAMHVGDDDKPVLHNRELLCHSLKLPAEPCWLEQTHSTRVVDLDNQSERRADAAITRKTNAVAVVMTADCLPILLCSRTGTEVAAIHAGWRGLADGIIETTVMKMKSPATELLAWIGPGISQKCFEVGDEVREIFIDRNGSAEDHFIANRPNHWLCDLPALAAGRLAALGIADITRPSYCSYTDETLFYSYRRNALTGRMASLIWIEPTSAGQN